MVLDFNHSLEAALAGIGNTKYYAFPVHLRESPRSDEELGSYADAKWKIVEMLNLRFAGVDVGKKQEVPAFRGFPTDLYNWLQGREDDEVAYFLNEAGSNALSHSEWKAPSHLHLWIGEKGFVIGIEQKGKGFNAREIHARRMGSETKIRGKSPAKGSIKKMERNNAGSSREDSGGAAFDFYRKCRSMIFFDNPKDARAVFMAVSVG